jgi:predicted Zn-dependent protease
MHKTMGPAAAKDPLLRDTILYLSTLHEIGHALGIGHSSNENDVMYTNGSFGNFERYRKRLATRTDIGKLAWLSDNDKAQLKVLYKR